MKTKQYEMIWLSIFNENSEEFNKLINSCKDINELDSGKLNYLQHAIARKQTRMATILINKGININNQDYKGMSPLTYAVYHHNYEIAKLLIEKGADIDLKDNALNTALWYACYELNFMPEVGYKIVQLLIDSGANPLSTNKVGKDSIAWATVYKDQKLFDILTSKLTDKPERGF